ncbi:GTPase HflX [bioreactor metagenome]|uniref:GTPase HflX n=1 Tax=bioreactor metagenome TaxID=1076179 RepID=A0A644ZHP4_9ZZZZ
MVEKTLYEIDKTKKPTILVFNKIDAFSHVEKEEDDLTPKTRQNTSLEELKQSWMSKLNENAIFISAKEKTNIEELKSLIYERAREIHIQRFPYNDFLYQTYDEETEI